MSVLSVSPAGSAGFVACTLVLIPALNEAACIEATIQFWRQSGFALVRVVDNGSADDTGQLAARAGAEVLHEPRRGYGAACWTGVQQLPLGIDWILFSSADGSDGLSGDEAAVWQRQIDRGVEFILGDRFSSSASSDAVH